MRLPVQLWTALLAAAEETTPAPAAHTDWLPHEFWPGVFMSVVFGIVGIALAALGFKVFDWMTPRMNIQLELSEKHNVAVAIVLGAVILGVCYIVANVVR
jgi:putative membrane protein